MKIKLFIKKHYKRVVTAVLVCVSLFVFSFSTLAAKPIPQSSDFTSLYMRVLKSLDGGAHGFGTYPKGGDISYIRGSLSGKGTNYATSAFTFDPSTQFYFDFWPDEILSYSSGIFQIKFSLLFEDANKIPLQVYGFNRHNFIQGEYIPVDGPPLPGDDSAYTSPSLFTTSLPYNNVSYTSTGITSSFFGYSRTCIRYDFTINIPLQSYTNHVEFSFRFYGDGAYNNGLVRTCIYNYSSQYFADSNNVPSYNSPDTNITDDYHSKEESVLNDVGSDVGTVNGIFDNFNNIFNSGNIPTGLLAVTNVFNLIYQNGVITNLLWFSITIGAFAFILGVLPILNKGG